MSTILFMVSLILGVISFLFFFWKRLKEDYISEKIFITAFIVLLGLGTGILVSIYMLAPVLPKSTIFNPKGIWFWLGLVGVIPGFLFGIYKFKMRFYEILEALILGLSFLSFWVFLIKTAIVSGFFVFLIILYFVIDFKYKSFTWYKSGKIGLSGLFVLGTLFLARSIVALVNPAMLSLIGKSDAIISAILAFIVFLSIYNLSESI